MRPPRKPPTSPAPPAIDKALLDELVKFVGAAPAVDPASGTYTIDRAYFWAVHAAIRALSARLVSLRQQMQRYKLDEDMQFRLVQFGGAADACVQALRGSFKTFEAAVTEHPGPSSVDGTVVEVDPYELFKLALEQYRDLTHLLVGAISTLVSESKQGSESAKSALTAVGQLLLDMQDDSTPLGTALKLILLRMTLTDKTRPG